MRFVVNVDTRYLSMFIFMMDMAFLVVPVAGVLAVWAIRSLCYFGCRFGVGPGS